MESQYTADEQKAIDILSKIGQKHLYENLAKFSAQDREKFAKQILTLEATYPGGLANYHKNSLKCLADAVSGVNPYEGYVPKIPKLAHVIDFNNADTEELEAIGLEEIKHTVFVLVAGGLGERLGFNGIKVSLPFELVTQESFLNYYIDFLMAYQKRVGTEHKILLSIMTSDDTHDQTVKLLEDNNYFGMPKDQISFMKQEKVPALINSEAHFVQKAGTLELETKPHGHGDIHTLIYHTGNSKKWVEAGKKWVCFFQDTNPLIFRSFPSLLGVSKKNNLELNFIGVPRKVGEAADVFVILHKDGEKEKTFIIEWALAEVFFKPHGGEPVQPDGWSYYQTNINGICLSLPEYHENLCKTQGLVAEFINPKYEDESKTKFKSAARLETKLPDYPRLLENHDRMGITKIERPFSFTTCKNDPKEASVKWKKGIPAECAGTCELDYYQSNIDLLRFAGVQIENPPADSKKNFAGIDYNFGAKIVLKPDFGVTVKEIKSKFKGTNKISARSTLILDGDIHIENLELDGSISIASKERREVKDLKVLDKNYVNFVAIDENEQNPRLKMRGYKAEGTEDIIPISF